MLAVCDSLAHQWASESPLQVRCEERHSLCMWGRPCAGGGVRDGGSYGRATGEQKTRLMLVMMLVWISGVKISSNTCDTGPKSAG